MQYRPSSAYNSSHWTTNSGAPVWNNNHSVTVGARGTYFATGPASRDLGDSGWQPFLPSLVRAGPVLLEDYQLIEKIAQFDRERIPERVVHARGASAKGFFEVLLAPTAGLAKLARLRFHLEAFG